MIVSQAEFLALRESASWRSAKPATRREIEEAASEGLRIPAGTARRIVTNARREKMHFPRLAEVLVDATCGRSS